jgi:hypothetical protein
MPKFLVEVPHKADQVECLKAIKILLERGSHFLTHAEFGCMDDEHYAWLIVDVDSHEEARNIVPPVYREQTRVVKLCNFTLEQVNEMMSHHTG